MKKQKINADNNLDSDKETAAKNKDFEECLPELQSRSAKNGQFKIAVKIFVTEEIFYQWKKYYRIGF